MAPNTPTMLANEIYGTLTEVNSEGNFHWSIYVVDEAGPDSPGWMIHATQEDSKTWRFESIAWDGPRAPDALVFVKIGGIMEGLNVEHLIEYLKDVPMAVPEDRKGLGTQLQFSSRVWFKEAIRLLDDSQMFVHCTDLESMMREITIEGSKAQNQNPDTRPLITVSTFAKTWDGY